MHINICQAVSLYVCFVTVTSSQEGSVRLVNGADSNEGRVEIFHNGVWGTVCHDDFRYNDATVVCLQLALSTFGEHVNQAAFGQGTGNIWLDNVACSGFENNLIECPSRGWEVHNCNHGEDAGVRCRNDSVRVLDGGDETEGRVEVLHKGEWGTVCDDYWDDRDAIVVCRQLGLGDDGVAVLSAGFGQGTGKTWLDNVGCTGYETSLHSCRNNDFSNKNCGHHQDAGVRCGNFVRLSGSHSATEGRVEIFHNDTWGTVCSNSWDATDATVVCRQLGLGLTGEAVDGSMYGEGNGPIWLDDVQCTGYETSLRLCRSSGWGFNSCQHHQDAGVRCDSSTSRQSNATLYVLLAILVVVVLILVIVVVIQRRKINGLAANNPDVNASHSNTVPILDQIRQWLSTIFARKRTKPENVAIHNNPSYQMSGEQVPPGYSPSEATDVVYNTVDESRNALDSCPSDEKGAVYNCVYGNSQGPKPAAKDSKSSTLDIRGASEPDPTSQYQEAMPPGETEKNTGDYQYAEY